MIALSKIGIVLLFAFFCAAILSLIVTWNAIQALDEKELIECPNLPLDIELQETPLSSIDNGVTRTIIGSDGFGRYEFIIRYKVAEFWLKKINDEKERRILYSKIPCLDRQV